jgi:hypothetical protein
MITDSFAFWGNVIGFLAVAAKTIYDLYINPRQFANAQSAAGRDTDALIRAAEAKRARADRSTALTFLVIGIGYAVTIFGLIKH